MARAFDRQHGHAASGLLTGATLATVLVLGSAQVDCGGHISDGCGNCPLDDDTGVYYGESWCNGECKWIDPHWFGFRGNCFNKDLQENTGGVLNEYAFCFLFSACVMLAFACVYHWKVVLKLPELHERITNMHSEPRELYIYSCLKAPETCIYSLCCLPIVAGKNYHVTKICNFWQGCVLTFIGTFFLPCYPVTAMVRAALSGQFRTRLGHDTSSLLKECCCSFFCMPCEVGRESLEVDEELGVKIECCYPHVDCSQAGVKRRIKAEQEEEERREKERLELLEQMAHPEENKGLNRSCWGFRGSSSGAPEEGQGH